MPAASPVPYPQPAQAERHPATVVYANGLLEITADNSSLSQVLRAIADATRMSIVGGVPDQPVFGHYGPAKPAHVLATLLDGTGTNMLLRESASDAPAELILTQQMGGPTPPTPIPGFDAQPVAIQPAPVAIPAPALTQLAPQPPRTNVGPPPFQPVMVPGATSVQQDPQPTGAGYPLSPNGVRTPQAYQQLQQTAQPPLH
jgi:hypothetical protein